MNTIFFGSIGSIVETSEIQRKAFNKAFQKFGLEITMKIMLNKKLLEIFFP